MELQRKIIDIEALTNSQRQEMYALMQKHYDNTDRTVFEKDLSEKNWVLMLLDESKGRIVGFSTKLFFPFFFRNKKTWILFSGDTIIQREYWGSLGLCLVFSELITRLIKKYQNEEIYWMLISKGLRTYKYLPTFFVNYYPAYDKATPEVIRELINLLGEQRFPGSFDKLKGIIKAKPNAQSLKKEFQPEFRLTNNIDVFFQEANPGYHKGDELLCLTKLSYDNFRPYYKRIIERVQ